MKQTIIYNDEKPISDGTVLLVWFTAIKDGENDLCLTFHLGLCGILLALKKLVKHALYLSGLQSCY